MKLEVGIGINEGNIEVGVKINENKSRAEEMYHFEVDCSDLISVRSLSKLGKRGIRSKCLRCRPHLPNPKMDG